MNSTSIDDRIVQEITINATAERIFEALTNPDQRINGGASKGVSRPPRWNRTCVPAASG